MPPVNARIRRLTWWGVAVGLLLLCFAARVWALNDVPPGLTHDEASNGHDSAAILGGVHRIYFPVGYGHEPLYNYSVAIVTALLGQSVFTLRLTTVIWGMAQIVLAAALARRWWGSQAALATMSAYAVSFWALMLARVGLRAPTLPALLTASVIAFDYAQGRSERFASRFPWHWYALSGLFLGLGFYTYMASRGMPLLYAGYLVATRLADRDRFQRVWRGTLVLLAVAVLVGAPLFIYLRLNPGLEQRIGQLGEAVVALGRGNVHPLWGNIVDSLPMLLWKGDPHWLYNIAGRPGLEPALGLTFVAGLVTVLCRPADHRSILLLLWLSGGLAPALLAPVAYNLLHGVAAMPAVFLLVARGLRTVVVLATNVVGRAGPVIRQIPVIALVLTLSLTGAGTYHAYFSSWATHPDVRVAYHNHVVELGHYLDRSMAPGPVVITSLYPGEYHDPYTMEVTLRRDDLSLNWVDGREAVYLPAKPARLFVEAQTALPAALWDVMRQDAVPFVTLTFGADAIPAETRGYLWDTSATWRRMATEARTAALIADGDPAQPAAHLPLDLPADYGAIVRFRGYTLSQLLGDGGATLELLTLWEVLAPTNADLVVFAHLLDGEGTLLTQDDRLGAPSWQWRPGDRFAQLHWLNLSPPRYAWRHVCGPRRLRPRHTDPPQHSRARRGPCGHSYPPPPPG